MNDKNNLHDFHTIDAKPVELESDYIFFKTTFLFSILNKVMVLLVKIFVYFIYGKLFHGLRIKNKKNLKPLKKEGYILVANHLHQFDAMWIGSLIYPRKIFVVMLETNLGIPYVGKLFRIIGGVPIPSKRDLMPNFLEELKKQLNKKRSILVLPEAALKPYHVGIRKFFNGAFRFAVSSEVKILPLVYIYKKRKGLGKLFRKKPKLELHILDPYQPLILSTKGESIKKAKDDIHLIMSTYFNNNSDLKDPNF